MSMKQQAPNKQITHASIKDQLLSLSIIDMLKEVRAAEEQAYNQAIIGQMGFVKVVPSKDTKLSMVNLVGMVIVSGQEAQKIQSYRRLKLNGNCPRWFREAVAQEALNPTGMHFRVSITGLSHSGKVAFVSPRAKSLENAQKEYQRRCEDIKRIIERDVFHSDADIARKAYEIYAMNNDLFIDRNYKLLGDAVVMSSYSSNPTVYSVQGGDKVALYIDGIKSGYTSWEKEIKENITSAMFGNFGHNILKEYLIKNV